MERDPPKKPSSDKYSKRDTTDNLSSSHSKRMSGSRPSPPKTLPPQTMSHSNNSTHQHSSNTTSYKTESSGMNQKPYSTHYSAGRNSGAPQNRPQPPDIGLNANLSLSEQNIKSQPPLVLPPTNRMEIEHSSANKSSNSNKVQHGQQTSSDKDMQIENEVPVQLEKEKSTSETSKPKILDPRLRNENSDLKRESSHSKDKQILEDVERFEKILKKIKKDDSSQKRELKRALDPSGGSSTQRFRMNYMILQALINAHQDSARNVVQELTEEMVDLSLENATHLKNRAVALSKAKESNGAMKSEGQDEHLIKVIHVPTAEIYKYNENLKEMEDKMDRLEQIIAEKKAKLNQTNQRISKIEIDSHRSKIKNEFIMKFEAKLS